MPTERFKTRAVRLSSFTPLSLFPLSPPRSVTVKMAEVKKSKTPKEFASESPATSRAPAVRATRRVRPGGRSPTCTDHPCPHSRFHDGRCFGREYCSCAPPVVVLNTSSWFPRPSRKRPLLPSSVSSSWCRIRMRWFVKSSAPLVDASPALTHSCLSPPDQAGPPR